MIVGMFLSGPGGSSASRLLPPETDVRLTGNARSPLPAEPTPAETVAWTPCLYIP